MITLFGRSYDNCTKSNLTKLYFANQLNKSFKLTDQHLVKLTSTTFFNSKLKKGDRVVMFYTISDFDVINNTLSMNFAFTTVDEFKLFDNYLATNETDKDIPIIIHKSIANKWMLNNQQV